jgi:hypothetical protein
MAVRYDIAVDSFFADFSAQVMAEFHAPRSMSVTEVGDTLAQLVWESFSDFASRGDAEIAMDELQVQGDDDHTSEEALIFFLWAHTRGTRLAFVGRAPDERIDAALRAMQTAVLDDMRKQGTPASELPDFEARIKARCSEYSQAAEIGQQQLGEAIVRHLTQSEHARADLAAAVRSRAAAVTSPLRDFFSDVQLTDA